MKKMKINRIVDILTLFLLKFAMVVILCGAEFDVSAQTEVRIHYKSQSVTLGATANDTIWIDGINWYVLKKTTIGEEKFAMLLAVDPLNKNDGTNSSGIAFGSVATYQGSDLQTYIANYYSTPSSLPEIKRLAVIPTLNGHPENGSVTVPTVSPAGSATTDILFPPNPWDIVGAAGGNQDLPVAYPFTLYTTDCWTRGSANNNSEYILRASTTPKVVNHTQNNVKNGDKNDVLGAIWVKYNDKVTVTYHGNGGSSGVAPASESLTALSQAIIKGPGVLQKRGYKFLGWAYDPMATEPDFRYNAGVFSPSYFNIEWNTDLYAVWEELTIYFTVNDDLLFNELGGKFCDAVSFSFEAHADGELLDEEVEWWFNGEQVLPNSTRFVKNNLTDGYYTVDMIAYGETFSSEFYVGGVPVIWTPHLNPVTNNRQNWQDPYNWTPTIVPTPCYNVYIPGNSETYPMLDDSNINECNKIYFMQGGELGRPDLLKYNEAYVHLNLDLKQTAQIKNDDEDLVLKNLSTHNRMLYSAGVSSEPLERGQWHFLSSPLRNVVSGDLCFGGFPLTYLRKFGPVDKNGQPYEVGQWPDAYNSMNEKFLCAEGFAFYMYDYNSGIDGTEESGEYNTLNDRTFLPSRANLTYGLSDVNGILELPFFENSSLLYAHRTQDFSGGESTFYYINASADPSSFNRFTGNTDEPVSRDEGNYRFAPEYYEDNEWKFEKNIKISGNGISNGELFIVGNPYMSSISMYDFLIDNSANATILEEIKLWNGTGFTSYTINGDEILTPNPESAPYIPPMQAFFLTTASDYNGSGDVVEFNVENISVTCPEIKLRSGKAEENILRIKAENGKAASYALISVKDNASNGFREGEDVKKLFSPLSYLPDVYVLADEIPVDIDFISNKGDAIVPLGFRTGQTGKISLTFTGMDNYYEASKIEFFDALENRTVDLTGKSSHTYTFNNMETGVSNGRFSLRIVHSATALPDVTVSDNLNVYGNSNGIYVVSSEPVQQVLVYDFQGRKVFESASGANYYPIPDNFTKSPLIVKVITKNGIKTVKLKTKN